MIEPSKQTQANGARQKELGKNCVMLSKVLFLVFCFWSREEAIRLIVARNWAA